MSSEAQTLVNPPVAIRTAVVSFMILIIWLEDSPDICEYDQLLLPSKYAQKSYRWVILESM